MKTTRKITIDFTTMIQVASAKLDVREGGHEPGTPGGEAEEVAGFAISTISAPLSRFALSSAVPSIRNAAPGRIRSRSATRARTLGAVRAHVDLVAVGEPEALGVRGRELDPLLGGQEAKRRRCAR